MSLRFLTAGESHGPGLCAILEGMPAGLPLSEEEIASDLQRRQAGYGRGGRMRIERDRAEITAGVAHGQTTGGPIALQVENRDWANWKGKPASETPPLTAPRPGHADWAGGIKYGQRDLRLVLERASARETAARVAVGSVCKQLLRALGIEVYCGVVSIGNVEGRSIAEAILRTDGAEQRAALAQRLEESPLRTLDPETDEAMRALIDASRKLGDTLGGVVEVVATGVIPGLGSHVHWDRKLDARLAAAAMSVQAIKGVEIGDGFAVTRLPGTRAHDGFAYAQNGRVIRGSNHAGGAEGGISNGQPIVVRAAMKPIATTVLPQSSIDLETKEARPATYQRSDTCAVPAASTVIEAMVCFVLAEAILDKFGGDTMRDLKAAIAAYLAESAYWLGEAPLPEAGR